MDDLVGIEDLVERRGPEKIGERVLHGRIAHRKRGQRPGILVRLGASLRFGDRVTDLRHGGDRRWGCEGGRGNWRQLLLQPEYDHGADAAEHEDDQNPHERAAAPWPRSRRWPLGVHRRFGNLRTDAVLDGRLHLKRAPSAGPYACAYRRRAGGHRARPCFAPGARSSTSQVSRR